MIVAASDSRQTAQIRQGLRSTRRGIYAPLFAPRALAAGTVVQDGEGDDGSPRLALAPRLALPGVDLAADGNGGWALRFDGSRFDQELAEVVALHLSGAELHAGPGPFAGLVATDPAEDDLPLAADVDDWSDGYPTDDDLKLIRRNHSLDPSIGRDDLFTFTRYVANDALSRGGWLRLTKRAIEKGAEDFAAGRAVCLHHDKRLVFGRTFAARVVRRTKEGLSARWIEVKGYAHRRESNQDTRDDIRLGVLAHDSITFTGGDVSLVEESVAASGDPKAPKLKRSFLQVDHDPESPTPFRAIETSFVFLGELHGAGNAKLDANAPAATPSASDRATPSGADGNPSGGEDDGSSVVILLP